MMLKRLFLCFEFLSAEGATHYMDTPGLELTLFQSCVDCIKYLKNWCGPGLMNFALLLIHGQNDQHVLLLLYNRSQL